jgi:hypothetical protein
MRRNRLEQYQRLRDEWRKIGSILFRRLTQDDLLKSGDKLGLNRHGALALDEGGMDFEVLGNFAVFEVLLADSRRAAEALAAVPEIWRSCVTEAAASSYSIYEVLGSDPEHCSLAVLDRLRGDRRDIMDVNLSRSISPRKDILFSWRLLRVEGINMTTGAVAPVRVEDFAGIQKTIKARIAVGASFRAAMVRSWPTILRKAKRLGIAMVSRS